MSPLTFLFPSSDSATFTAIGTFSVGLVVLILWQWLRSLFVANFPPGPTPYPIVGNLLSVPRSDRAKVLDDMAKEFGNVIYFHGLGQKIVVVNNRKSLSELIIQRSDVTSGRPRLVMCGDLVGYDKSIVLRQPSSELREMRRTINLAVGVWCTSLM